MSILSSVLVTGDQIERPPTQGCRPLRLSREEARTDSAQIHCCVEPLGLDGSTDRVAVRLLHGRDRRRLTSDHSIDPKICRYSALLRSSDGVAIRVYELLGANNTPAIVFGHGCGFAARADLAFLSALTGHRVFAFDARGHGGSSGQDCKLHNSLSIEKLAMDLAIVGAFMADRTGEQPYYVGQSMNGATALWPLAFGDASSFSGFTLFEPAIFPPVGHPTYGEAYSKHHRLIARSARRRSLEESQRIRDRIVWPRAIASFVVARSKEQAANMTDNSHATRADK
jgi:pimeloyl-ACP methyl ester carboxylesterase